LPPHFRGRVGHFWSFHAIPRRFLADPCRFGANAAIREMNAIMDEMEKIYARGNVK